MSCSSEQTATSVSLTYILYLEKTWKELGGARGIYGGYPPSVLKSSRGINLCYTPSLNFLTKLLRNGQSNYYYYYTRLTAPFQDYSGERHQKGKTNLDFTEARDSEWQWHQLGHMQVCTSLQTDNHASTPPLSFLQAGCPSCRPTNSVKALKA